MPEPQGLYRPRRRYRRIGGLYHRVVTRGLGQPSAMVLPASAIEARELAELVPTERMTVRRNSIDVDGLLTLPSRIYARGRNNLASEDRLVFFLGRIVEIKNLDVHCTLLLRPGYSRDIGEFNDPTYNRLVDQGEVEFNRSKSLQLYVKAQHIALSTGAWISVGNANAYARVNPYVHGFVGSEALFGLILKGNEWANVSIGSHCSKDLSEIGTALNYYTVCSGDQRRSSWVTAGKIRRPIER